MEGSPDGRSSKGEGKPLGGRLILPEPGKSGIVEKAGGTGIRQGNVYSGKKTPLLNKKTAGKNLLKNSSWEGPAPIAGREGRVDRAGMKKKKKWMRSGVEAGPRHAPKEIAFQGIMRTRGKVAGARSAGNKKGFPAPSLPH